MYFDVSVRDEPRICKLSSVTFKYVNIYRLHYKDFFLVGPPGDAAPGLIISVPSWTSGGLSSESPPPLSKLAHVPEVKLYVNTISGPIPPGPREQQPSVA